MVEWTDLGHSGPMEKLYLEYVQATIECERALKITTDILAHANRDLHGISAAIRESEAKIAKSKLLLQGLYRGPTSHARGPRGEKRPAT